MQFIKRYRDTIHLAKTFDSDLKLSISMEY